MTLIDSAPPRAWAYTSPWTDAALVDLRRMWDEGRSCSLIAQALGLTRNAVIGKVHRLGLPKRKEVLLSRNSERHYPKQRSKPKPEKVPTLARLFNSAVAEAGPIMELPPDQSAFAVSLLDIQHNQCRWPVSDEPFLFCGDEKWSGHSYCLRHFAIARRPA